MVRAVIAGLKMVGRACKRITLVVLGIAATFLSGDSDAVDIMRDQREDPPRQRRS